LEDLPAFDKLAWIHHLCEEQEIKTNAVRGGGSLSGEVRGVVFISQHLRTKVRGFVLEEEIVSEVFSTGKARAKKRDTGDEFQVEIDMQ